MLKYCQGELDGYSKGSWALSLDKESDPDCPWEVQIDHVDEWGDFLYTTISRFSEFFEAKKFIEWNGGPSALSGVWREEDNEE